jgi:hypothetical protein
MWGGAGFILPLSESEEGLEAVFLAFFKKV